MPQFHETVMGKRFIEGTVPALVRSMDKLTEALNKNLDAASSGVAPADGFAKGKTSLAKEIAEELGAVIKNINRPHNGPS